MKTLRRNRKAQDREGWPSGRRHGAKLNDVNHDGAFSYYIAGSNPAPSTKTIRGLYLRTTNGVRV